MAKGYYKMNREVLQFDYEKDLQKIIFNHYLMRKENLSAMNKKLEPGHFPLTVRTISKDLNMSIGATHRMLKEFEKLSIIELVEDGKKTKTSSIYKYNTVTKNNTTEKNNTSFGTSFGTDFGTSKIDNINTKDLKLWMTEFGR